MSTATLLYRFVICDDSTSLHLAGATTQRRYQGELATVNLSRGPQTRLPRPSIPPREY
jgi:hypothetical protein